MDPSSLDFECPRCKAPVGSPCKSPSGSRRWGNPHVERETLEARAAASPSPKSINELRVDKHMLQAWHAQAVNAAGQIFHFALDGRVSRQRLLDLHETLSNLAERVGRAAGNED